MLQRDAFIEEITKKLEIDKSIYFLSADFGAAALDDLRKKFPKNFLHCGISEQAMLDIASGLALEGNKVFVYAMAPFISLRSIEQTKCGAGLMNLPICILSVGIGLGQDNLNTGMETKTRIEETYQNSKQTPDISTIKNSVSETFIHIGLPFWNTIEFHLGYHHLISSA